MRQKSVVGVSASEGIYAFESCRHIDDSQIHGPSEVTEGLSAKGEEKGG